MARLDDAFVSAETEDMSRPFDALPRGDYVVHVNESKLEDNSKGTGKTLTLVVEVLEGEYTGRLIWVRINYINANAQAQAIGRSLLKSITDAIGIPVLEETEDLHFKPFIGKVKIVKDKTGEYPDKNDLAGAKALSATGSAPAARPAPAKAAAAPRAAASAPASRPATPGAKPWPSRAAKPAAVQPELVDDDIPF